MKYFLLMDQIVNLAEENTRLRADLRRLQEEIVKHHEVDDRTFSICAFCGSFVPDTMLIPIRHKENCLVLTCQAALGSKHE